MSKSIVIFEAGGTKTQILFWVNDSIASILQIPGYNPNRKVDEFKAAFQNIEIPINSNIFFYGAGLESNENKEKVKLLFNEKKISEIEVFSDQLGAARAAFSDSKGIIGILGTGAFAGYYDGTVINIRKGGYGYLIDDIGGGLELGKYLVSKWLNNELSNKLSDCLKSQLKYSKENFLFEYYSKPNIDLITSLPICLLNSSEESEIQEICHHYFGIFAERHLRSIVEKSGLHEISLVGSIAENFLPYLITPFKQVNINQIHIITNQTEKILEFHLKKLRT